MGPDLTSISRRFMKKEILKSIIYPSHTIPDRYASRKILTIDGKIYSGIVAPGAEGEKIVLQSNGEKAIIAEDDIDDIATDAQSAMPSGLLDKLTLEEIADLFMYLSRPPVAAVARQPDE